MFRSSDQGMFFFRSWTFFIRSSMPLASICMGCDRICKIVSLISRKFLVAASRSALPVVPNTPVSMFAPILIACNTPTASSFWTARLPAICRWRLSICAKASRWSS